jgi:hypothetical protein
MAKSVTLYSNILADGENIGGTITINSGKLVSISEDAPSEVTGLTVALTIDVSALRMLFLLSDVDLTVTFNGPDNEFIVVGGTPFVWHYLGNIENPFGSTDVTSLTVDNDGTVDGTLKIKVLTDPTP